jgi:hypothetical protein
LHGHNDRDRYKFGQSGNNQSRICPAAVSGPTCKVGAKSHKRTFDGHHTGKCRDSASCWRDAVDEFEQKDLGWAHS